MSSSRLKIAPDLVGLLMSQDIAEKYRGWDVNQVSEFPNVRLISEPVVGGVFSYTIPARKHKIILQNFAINLHDTITTPSAVAREYLLNFYGMRRRAFNHQRLKILAHRSAPLYVRPALYKDMVYADIQATYWSIMSMVGWDVDYCPSEFLLAGAAPMDYPLPQHKLARNCLWSAGLLQQVELWNGSAWSSALRGSQLVNYSLTACTLDILNAMAWEALEHGAVYIHTDGYIIPRTRFESLAKVAALYGLTLREKGKGDATVLGIGNYSIGEKRTQNFAKFGMMRPITALQLQDREFLKRELYHIVDKQTAQTVYKERRL